MKRKVQLLRRSATWKWWQLLYVVLSLSWLLGPSANHHLSAKTAFISQYEDPGQPWSWLYRLCDIVAAGLLGLAVVVIVRRGQNLQPRTKFYTINLVLLGIIALGLLVDDAFPSTCHNAANALCLVPAGLSRLIHAGESAGTVAALVALNVMAALRGLAWARLVLFIQLLWIAVFFANQLFGQPAIGLAQFGYQIAVTLWLSMVVLQLAGYRPQPRSDSRMRVVTHAIAAWVCFGGFIAIANAIRNLKEISQLSAAYFGNNTAWLSQHGVAVGIILIYVSRHLWRGEYRAWQLTSILLWLETLKYAIITPDGALVLLYGLTAPVLFVLRGAFDRQTSVEQLQDRLKKLAFVALAVILALVAGIVALRLKHHQDLDSLRFSTPEFLRHLFLVDVVNDLGPVSRRLLGQVVNVAGLALLLAVLVSLFRPYRPLLRSANEVDRRQLLELLASGSTSSEDYFKYWPQPKLYWWNEARDAVITYRVLGNVAFALADPISVSPVARPVALQQFREYCRRYGWRACFLMVTEAQHALYKESNYKLFRVGASAVVDIEDFANQTSRNKWWRWVLNKAKKQAWQYELASPPHSPRLMAELRRVSDTWLQRQNHQERGFALGYFDIPYLQDCRLHLLRSDQRLIAFANELPTYNQLPTTTIDLMRFLPGYKHAMPTLLANTIEQLHNESRKSKFDLGFVPLASPAARTEQVITVLGQLLISEAVSAQGLEQFKNKFAPAWADNYIAFDGDWIDLIHISRQLDNLLTP